MDEKDDEDDEEAEEELEEEEEDEEALDCIWTLHSTEVICSQLMAMLSVPEWCLPRGRANRACRSRSR